VPTTSSPVGPPALSPSTAVAAHDDDRRGASYGARGLGAVAAVGRHVIVDMWAAQNLNAPEVLEEGLRRTVDAIEGTLIDLRVHTYPMQGVTGVAIIAESHVAVHTWPEYGYAAVDIFTCNLQADVHAGVAVLARCLMPAQMMTREIARGERPISAEPLATTP
jgi:S-adenosylmethionine decarboxylase